MRFLSTRERDGGVIGRTSSLDRWLVGRSARVRATPADRALKALSTAADKSRLWMALGAVLFVAGDRSARRGAVRGLLALGIASGVANGVAKPLFPRRRPPDESVPFVRRLVAPPVSSSFPSGHAASAAAFVTGLALESPAAAVAVAPVAAAVGYSRVHIGVHWPSDVVAGALFGSAVALVTRRWWAVRDDEPAALGPVEHIDPLPKGAGLLLIGNPHAGSGDGDDALADLRERLPAAEVLELGGDDFEERVDELVRRDDLRALGVVGGDGTVSAVAEYAVRHRLPLAVFAGGTLNHFARDAGVERTDVTVAGLEAGEAVRVDVAGVCLDGAEQRTFVNTASLGGYPDFVRVRERWERRIGKWPAAGIAMVRVLFRAQPLHVTVDGAHTALWMLFVGNGTYHPADQIPMSRPELRGGTLDVRYLRADVPFSRLRLVFATFTGTLEYSPTYRHRRVSRVDVRVAEEAVSLATDGEVDHRGKDFRFTSGPSALMLIKRGRAGNSQRNT
ncbi:bifunctional phosphatase PAP2/diacylglycerol kinase family protein [Nocardia sp. NPDC059691]|uniref:bifunctional phosphatase PAP2/diacylglycerol kinase family protein n=1 Tax=Nocardia sp. NPDC059691 TaxID=3346908 RepID=UPI0036BB0AB1